MASPKSPLPQPTAVTDAIDPEDSDDESPRSSTSKKRKEAPEALAMFHPTSEWLEPYRDDGLTLYEIHRPPRRLDSSLSSSHQSSEVRLRRNLHDVSSEFRCGICLHYITNARIVRSCLHRFCYDCVEMALRKRYKKCPICRTPMGSRRSLAPDPNFDRLVRALVGDPTSAAAPILRLEEEEALQFSHHAEQLQQAIRRKRQLQLLRQQQQQDQPHQMHNVPLQSSSTLDSTTAAPNAVSKTIVVELLPHANETELGKLNLPYLRLSASTPLRVLQTFVQRKLMTIPSAAAMDGEQDTGATNSDTQQTHRMSHVQFCVMSPDHEVIRLDYSSRPTAGNATDSSNEDDLVLLGTLYKKYKHQCRLRLLYHQQKSTTTTGAIRHHRAFVSAGIDPR